MFNRDLRKSVIFGRHDLVRDAPISKVDLLMCRNTLMYFNTEMQSRILAHFHFALSQGGFLVLGRAELLFTQLRSLSPVDIKRRVFVKTGGEDGARDRLILASQYGGPEQRQLSNHVRSREVAFDASPVAQMLVDRKGFVILANRRIRNLFGLADEDIGRPLRDLPLSYRPVELRSRIDDVLATGASASIPDVPWTTPSGEEVRLHVDIIQLSDETGRPIGISITFDDVTRFLQVQEELEHSTAELETAMEELQSTNEELETTNEELETTNEELQSTNEELETMNEELQSTNEELEAMNEEFRERSAELIEVNAFLESILQNVQGAVVVVDRELRIRMWNDRSEDMWGLRSDEVKGRDLFELDIGLPVRAFKGVIADCLAGSSDRAEVRVDAINRRGRSITCRVSCTPLRGASRIEGAILVIEEDGEIQEVS
jgi:two-component system CheB/CheR fusion protein